MLCLSKWIVIFRGLLYFVDFAFYFGYRIIGFFQNLSFHVLHGATHFTNTLTQVACNLWQFIRTQIPDRADSYREWLTLDLYLRENVKNRPAFAGENQVTKEEMTAFYREEAETHRYLKEYDGFDARQLRKMTHLEKIDGKYLLFDYRNRSRLSQNAATYEVCFSNE